jgi:histidinol-phosphate aminotransferase
MHDLPNTGCVEILLTKNNPNLSRQNWTTIEQRVTRWVRPAIRSLAAYKVANATGLIKLDAMENPYPLPAGIRAHALAVLNEVQVNRYPDPEAMQIQTALRKLYDLNEQTAIMFGNGSDEIIQILALVLGGQGRKILSLEPGFVMYKLISVYTGSDYIGVPLTESFEIDRQATIAAIADHQPALIFIAQPNNPTGNLFSNAALRAIIEAAPGVVVIDEAYTAFANADYMSWLCDYDNVLIMRTFSKLGLAGLRLGMLFGHPNWISEFNKVRLPYNINSLTQAAALAALEGFEELLDQTRELREERAFLSDELAAISAVTVYPSEANFILIRLPHSATQIFNGLREAGVLVKLMAGGHALLAECLRITVGAREENLAFLSAFRKQCKILGLG